MSLILRPDTEYHDPVLPGSLISALRMWQTLSDADRVVPRQLAFGFACASETQARHVALVLRRRVDCSVAMVCRDERTLDAWRVEGRTRPERQSLSNLERLFTWLRRAALKQQVHLTGLAMR